MAVRAHDPQDLHARRPVGRPGVLDPEGAAPAQRAHELRRRREARHARKRETIAAAVDLDGDRARRVRVATGPDAEGPKIGKRCEVGDGKLRADGVDAEAYERAGLVAEPARPPAAVVFWALFLTIGKLITNPLQLVVVFTPTHLRPKNTIACATKRIYCPIAAALALQPRL